MVQVWGSKEAREVNNQRASSFFCSPPTAGVKFQRSRFESVAVNEDRILDVPPARSPRHVQDHGDGVNDTSTEHFPGQSSAVLHGATGYAGQGGLRAIGVDGSERAAMAGVEGLE